MNKTIRYIMYVVIMIICIVSVFVGVYAVELKIAKDQRAKMEQEAQTEEPEKKIEKTTTEKFKELFTNEFFGSQFDDSAVAKVEAGKPIVYAWSKTVNKEGKYAIDAHLPAINIDSPLAKQYNENTQRDFISKINDLTSETTENAKYTIFETNFTSYINEDILSIAIMASLKEGSNAQRVIVRTYNYNLKTQTEVKLQDIINKRGLEENAINTKIMDTIKEAADEADSVAKTGYDIYKRNIDSDIYTVEKATNFIQGPNGELYIIYDYGSSSNTSEMDVIEI